MFLMIRVYSSSHLVSLHKTLSTPYLWGGACYNIYRFQRSFWLNQSTFWYSTKPTHHPQKQGGTSRKCNIDTKQWHFFKGVTVFKPSFWVSMLIFAAVYVSPDPLRKGPLLTLTYKGHRVPNAGRPTLGTLRGIWIQIHLIHLERWYTHED